MYSLAQPFHSNANRQSQNQKNQSMKRLPKYIGQYGRLPMQTLPSCINGLCHHNNPPSGNGRRQNTLPVINSPVGVKTFRSGSKPNHSGSSLCGSSLCVNNLLALPCHKNHLGGSPNHKHAASSSGVAAWCAASCSHWCWALWGLC
jgi:hypothetical protein